MWSRSLISLLPLTQDHIHVQLMLRWSSHTTMGPWGGVLRTSKAIACRKVGLLLATSPQALCLQAPRWPDPSMRGAASVAATAIVKSTITHSRHGVHVIERSCGECVPLCPLLLVKVGPVVFQRCEHSLGDRASFTDRASDPTRVPITVIQSSYDILAPRPPCG